jgi:NADH-quinone oxidoreductase subunit L
MVAPTLLVLVVTGVGALIHVYSVGYMADDDAFARYFAYLNLFMASMLTLVLAGNLVVMFIGWEGVGLCSYLLIAFWFTRPAAAAAGVKAFLVTRLGDVGFLLGIFLAFGVFGTADFGAMTSAAAARLPGSMSATTAPFAPIAFMRVRHIRPSPPAPITRMGSWRNTASPTRFNAPYAVRPEQA